MTKSELVETRRILSDDQLKKLEDEISKKDDIVKGSCFDEFLDNIDKHTNII